MTENVEVIRKKLTEIGELLQISVILYDVRLVLQSIILGQK